MAKGSTIAATRGEDDWRTESDLRTMIEYEAICKDPKRMAKVQALAKSRMMEMASIATEGMEKS
jgi:hypothetical protein